MTISIDNKYCEMSYFIDKREKTINPNVVMRNDLQFQQKRGNDKKVATGVAFTTAVAVLGALAGIAKHQGFNLNFKKIFSESPTKWAIFKYKDDVNGSPLKLEEKEIITLAGSSIIGGLIGGRIFDKKEEFKAKLKESVSQMLGDVLVPLGFVAVPSRWYQRNSEKISGIMYQFKNPKNIKSLNTVNKLMRAFPALGIMGASLGAGIIVGNRVSNFINEKVYHKKVQRNIRATDFAPHLDDICLASTLMSNGTSFSKIVSRFVPLALMVAGNEVGNAKDD